MANVPSIPPLLSSTPPPIDFGENDDDSGLSPTLTLEDDDDVYGDFTLSNERINHDVLSLPRTPLQHELSSSTTSGYTEAPPAFEDNCLFMSGVIKVPPMLPLSKIEDSMHDLVEAINHDVNGQNISNVPTTDDSAPEAPTETELVERQHSAQELTVESSPCSLKLDTFSLNSEVATPPQSFSFASEDVGVDENSSSFSELQKEIKDESDESRSDGTKAWIKLDTEHQMPRVILEDIIDDSSDDEQHSPKKVIRSDEELNENSDAFFAIHTLDAILPSVKDVVDKEQGKDEKEEAKERQEQVPDVDDDFAEFANFERATESTTSKHNKIVAELADADDTAPMGDFAFEADFSQFAIPTHSHEHINTSTNIPEAKHVGDTDGTDDFDDFQDFSTAENSATKLTIVNASADVAEDEDDEFCDFTEAAAINQQQQQKASAAVNLSNLHERLKPVLEMMFPTCPSTVELEREVALETQTNSHGLQLKSIDAANALQYQWSSSEMRHALIKSLGIDSRNILFGEKWNSAMPRFAANLSFNPLQPLKPQTATSSTMANGLIADEENPSSSVESKSHDVPAVEFDWNSSGLVNPLDGKPYRALHAHSSCSSNPLLLSISSNNTTCFAKLMRSHLNSQTFLLSQQGKKTNQQ